MQNDTQWLQKLQIFINKKLMPITKDQKERNQFLTPDSMAIWAKAFTHETYDPSFNYEELEFQGDAILKSVFPEYLMTRFPHLSKDGYTDLNSKYMGAVQHFTLSQKMGFAPFIRVRGLDYPIQNIQADLLESFFGALNAIANNIVKGLGYIYSYNMIAYLFEDIYIDGSKSNKGSEKTQVQQIFTRFDLPKPNEKTYEPSKNEYNVSILLNPNINNQTILEISKSSDVSRSKSEHDAYSEAIKKLSEMGIITVKHTVTENFRSGSSNMITFSVELLPEHIKFLNEYSVNVTNKTIGSASAQTKKEAEAKAYTNALDTLTSYGITSDWAEKAKLEKDLSDPIISGAAEIRNSRNKNYADLAKERAKNEGFDSLKFAIPRKTVTPSGAVVQLLGITKNGYKRLLCYIHTTDRSNSYQIAKATIVKNYATRTDCLN